MFLLYLGISLCAFKKAIARRILQVILENFVAKVFARMASIRLVGWQTSSSLHFHRRKVIQLLSYPGFYKLTRRYLDFFISEVKSQQQKMALDGYFWSKEDIVCVCSIVLRRHRWIGRLWNEVFDMIICVPTLTWEYATDKEKGKIENEEDSGPSDNEEKEIDGHEPSEKKLDEITEMDEQTVNNENIESAFTFTDTQTYEEFFEEKRASQKACALETGLVYCFKSFQLFVNFVNDTLLHMFQLVKDDNITLSTCKFVCANGNEDKVANLVKLSKQEMELKLLDKYKQFDTIVNLFKRVISRYFIMKDIPKDLTLCYIFFEKANVCVISKNASTCHDAFESKVFSKIWNEVKQSCQGNLKVIMEQCAVQAKEK
ncbi:hypothetical protein RFI_35498 [Reticulomyxa filosa]|uniref:Uncharacterized protein n=1 Tax=Reticulomyxa filosa TaxID=46433 RepID=X6LLE1_RETFI|nr:hypothetical protein RFI_35498 [Reticulomyxa filosa]|eukprot:ETO01942.1 hypothetical protein RFI_35498 [Reticulomyxa filosa]